MVNITHAKIVIVSLLFLLTINVFSEDISIKKEKINKGIVTFVDGKVKKKLIDDTDWTTDVVEKGKVSSKESYKTMIKSRAELELAEMDVIRLAPKTTVDIVALFEESFYGKKKTEIKLEEGDLWAQVNSADEDSEFEMDTDISAAAITGTNFRITKSNDQTQMKVYHGEVKIANSKTSLMFGKPTKVNDFNKPKQTIGPKQIAGPKQISLNEWIYVVKNMQQITFDKNGKVISAGDFSSKDKSEQNDWILWNKKRDKARGMH